MPDSSDFTERLDAATRGSSDAVDALFPLVYDELRSYASGLLKHPGEVNVEPTGLVHEVYLKLVDQTRATYENRVHFLAVAARALRRILVDHARKSKALKRGGDRRAVTLHSTILGQAPAPVDVLDLEDAMHRLAEEEFRAAKVVELRFFSGLDIPAVASYLDISVPTAERDWRFARAWLYRELSRS